MALPRGVYCKNCGYGLAGCAENGTCPECSRAFDAADVRSFDPLARRERRVRRLKRIVGVALVLGALWSVAPRGYIKARVTVNKGAGPASVAMVRLAPPRWLAGLGVIYPGWSCPVPVATTAADLPSGRGFRFMVQHLKFGLIELVDWGTTIASGTAESLAENHQLNGVEIDINNAQAMFDTVVPDMAAGRPFGVHVGPGGAESGVTPAP